MLNRAVNQVANGRRLAARRVVMNTLSTIDAQIWRKRIVYNNDTNSTVPEDLLSFEANALSVSDEPNYEYDFVGLACVLTDKFNGGYIHKNSSMNNPSDLVLLAQIEPFDSELPTKGEQIKNIPDITLKEGDVLGLMIYEDFIVWFEIVGNTGQTLMADFGTKYILNRRDEPELSPMKD